MANTIKQKRGTTDPGATDLVVGELAINTTDGGVFTKTDGGTVVEVGSGGGGASAINDLSDAVTYDSGLSIGLGTNALANDDGTDNNNTAVGYNALTANTSGSSNTCIGRSAGETVTTGSGLTLVGEYAGRTLTTSYNVAVGQNALSNNSSPARCTAVGTTALLNGGTDNVAVGHESAKNGTSAANRSVSIGTYSGYENEGDDNVFLGYYSGVALTSGDDNVFLGSKAGEAVTTGSNNIVIGYDADASSATASNEITLGNTSHTSLRIPGLQSGASDGQVLTYNSTNGNITLADASGGGLSEFVESQETASPNDTRYVDALTATDSTQTNLDVAFVAKGNGATLAQVPDSTTAGGDKRGTYATDFQKIRGNANQVASAGYSVICGGENNKVTGAYSSVVGGKNCVAGTGYYALAGGENTTASGYHSFCHGYATAASSSRTASIGGYAGTTSGNDSGRLAGYFCQPSGTQSATIAGAYHVADSQNSVVIGGQRGDTRSTVGKVVIPGSKIPIEDKAGVTQLGLLLLGTQTTDATATTLRSNSSSASSTNQVTLDNNTAYYFKGNVIAGVTGAGNTRAWTFEGAIKRGSSASTTALVGTVIKNDIAYDSGAADWDVAITADTSNGCLKLVVTGQASTTIRWVAKVETTEMGF